LYFDKIDSRRIRAYVGELVGTAVLVYVIRVNILDPPGRAPAFNGGMMTANSGTTGATGIGITVDTPYSSRL
jgi:hypothetical protein